MKQPKLIAIILGLFASVYFMFSWIQTQYDTFLLLAGWSLSFCGFCYMDIRENKKVAIHG